MNYRRLAGLSLTTALAAFAWLRDTAWLTSAGDSLPALAAFPLVAWLGRPWRWRAEAARVPIAPLAGATALFVAGSAFDLAMVVAAAWCWGVGVWLWSELEGGRAALPLRLLTIAFCGFPWIALDAHAIGWWFRYSGAAAAEQIFHGAGFAVARDGTFLRVQGLPLSVDAACSGLNALQAMLLGGAALAALLLPGRRYWLGLVSLPLLAWLANVARIIMLGLIGLSFGAEAAQGWFHHWGGWALLCTMFLLSALLFRLLGGRPARAS